MASLSLNFRPGCRSSAPRGVATGTPATRAPTDEMAQIEVAPGRPAENVERMRKAISEAKAAGADLVVFPEMAVGGYLLGDAWRDDSVCRELMRFNDVLR